MKAVRAKEATSRTTRGGTRHLQNLPVSAGTYAIAAFGQFVFIDECSDKRIKAAELELSFPAVLTRSRPDSRVLIRFFQPWC